MTTTEHQHPGADEAASAWVIPPAAEPAPDPQTSPAGKPGRKGRREVKRAARAEARAADNGTWEWLTGKTPAGLVRSPRRNRIGWYEAYDEPTLTTTRQVVPTMPALVGAGETYSGPPLGIDTETGQLVGSDPYTLYDLDVIQSGNVLILGDVGTAKSSTVKCHYAASMLAQDRRVCVFDRKLQLHLTDGQTVDVDSHGEYGRVATLAEKAGLTVARLVFSADGNGARINLLDPKITRAGKQGNQVGQDDLLRMVAEVAHGRKLDTREVHCLTIAHQIATGSAAAEQRVAILSDVVEALFTLDSRAIPHEHLAELGVVDEKAVLRWALDLGISLSRYLDASSNPSGVDGDLSGLIDGHTQAMGGDPVNMECDLLIVDTSELPENSTELMLVMAIMATYVAAVWGRQARQSITVVEEGYAADLPMVGEVFKSLAKRNRGLGNLLVMVMHHLIDVAADSPMRALVNEVGIVHVFRQQTEEHARDVITTWSLPVSVEDLTSLPKGAHLLIEGTDRRRRPLRRIYRLRTALDEWLTYTDDVMSSGPPPADPFAEPTPGELGAAIALEES